MKQKITIPQGTEKISIEQFDNRIVIELIPKCKFKDGDVVFEDGRIMIVKSLPNKYHVNLNIASGDFYFDSSYGLDFSGPTFRYATAEEKQKLNELLKKNNKRWNAEKKCIEDVSVYKDGDFVVNDVNSVLILKEINGCYILDHAYLHGYDELIIDEVGSYFGVKRHATTEEKQRMINALSGQGKRWNEDKKCIEDIPKRKFKAGDKVRIKEGISSKTHWNISPTFVEGMDDLIGKTMTVDRYVDGDNYVECEGIYWSFLENWLEPCSEEPKVGDWVIFWDHSPKIAKVGILTDIMSNSGCKYRIDGRAHWMHAVKWDGTKEHIEKVRKE